jgi:hypothetical protein
LLRRWIEDLGDEVVDNEEEAGKVEDVAPGE